MAKQELRGERNWYAIHTYAGYENAVLRNLKQRIDSLGMNDKIFNVIVPTEKKIKIKAGKRAEVEEKVYPGYVLVDMIVDDNSWYVVRNTPRVTGFVGAGVNPVPLEKSEVDALFGKMDGGNAKHHEEARQEAWGEDPVRCPPSPGACGRGGGADEDFLREPAVCEHDGVFPPCFWNGGRGRGCESDWRQQRH